MAMGAWLGQIRIPQAAPPSLGTENDDYRLSLQFLCFIIQSKTKSITNLLG